VGRERIVLSGLQTRLFCLRIYEEGSQIGENSVTGLVMALQNYLIFQGLSQISFHQDRSPVRDH